MTAKVSIIMGIYNCAQTLPTAIDSVLAQTYTNWELIMCDDGSKDNTYEIAKSYQRKYPGKIVLLKNKENKKLAATLNYCLFVATGEYIARMDADDENMPERLAREVAFLNKHPEITCVGSSVIVFVGNGSEYIRLNKGNPKNTCLIHGAPCAHPTIMMRKAAYDKLHGYRSVPETMRAEDIDLWFRFFREGFTVHNIQEPLYRYRETISDYKKRTMKAAIGTTKVFLGGYRMLHYPIYYYPYAFKPIIAALIPKKLMQMYHYYLDSRRKK
ncbi:glycosyltransferase [Blautia schinkii]|nr:glycosyltransferase [Blautia schinkii]